MGNEKIFNLSVFLSKLGKIFFNHSLNTQLMVLLDRVSQETDINNKYEF